MPYFWLNVHVVALFVVCLKFFVKIPRKWFHRIRSMHEVDLYPQYIYHLRSLLKYSTWYVIHIEYSAWAWGNRNCNFEEKSIVDETWHMCCSCNSLVIYLSSSSVCQGRESWRKIPCHKTLHSSSRFLVSCVSKVTSYGVRLACVRACVCLCVSMTLA